MIWKQQSQSQLHRWISTKYIAKVAKANTEWAAKARRCESGEEQYFFDFLEERGLIKDIAGTRENLRTLLNVKRVPAYAGVDPTASSLHLGHVVSFMPIIHMYLRGYPAFILVGSATAKVGDPSGRLTTRDKMDSSAVRSNNIKITDQLKAIWLRAEQMARRYGWSRSPTDRRGVEQNGAWWNKQTLFEMLTYFGNDVRLGPLLSRDTFKNRMNVGEGISLSEFLYPVMQAWDWWKLWTRLGVQIQVGGSDQFGNIITGIEVFKVIRKNEPDPNKRIDPGLLSDPVGFTVPLLTDSSGAKLGKSAGNALWLDPFLYSSNELYTHLMHQSDEKAGELLKMMTLIPTAEINELMATHMQDPSKMRAHHRLAHEVVWLCHGLPAATEAEKRYISIHGARFPENELPSQASGVPALQRDQVASSVVGDIQLPRSILTLSIAKILVAAGMVATNSEGQRLANQGGAYIGGKPGADPSVANNAPSYQIHWTPIKNWLPEHTSNFLEDGKYLYLRKGKSAVRIVELVSDEEWKESGKTYPGEPFTGKLRLLREALADTKSELERRHSAGENIMESIKELEEAGEASQFLQRSGPDVGPDEQLREMIGDEDVPKPKKSAQLQAPWMRRGHQDKRRRNIDSALTRKPDYRR